MPREPVKKSNRPFSSGEFRVAAALSIPIGRSLQSTGARVDPAIAETLDPSLIIVDADSRLAGEVPRAHAGTVTLECGDPASPRESAKLEDMVCYMRRRLKNGNVRLFFRKHAAR